jgi:hypothetical protein
MRQNIHYRLIADDPPPKTPQKCRYFPSSRQPSAFPSYLRGGKDHHIYSLPENRFYSSAVHSFCSCKGTQSSIHVVCPPLYRGWPARLYDELVGRKERKNIISRAVGSADSTTGYVFGLHLKFDHSLDPDGIERHAIASGDYEVKLAYRQHARLWLRRDYIEAVKKTRAQRFGTHAGSLRGNIAATYEDVAKRDDVEMLDNLDDDLALPKDGILVHGKYTMYGHFFFLKKLLDNIEKVRFFPIRTQPSGLLVCLHFSIRYVTPSGKAGICPLRMAIQSGRLWPRVWCTRSYGSVETSG